MGTWLQGGLPRRGVRCAGSRKMIRFRWKEVRNGADGVVVS